MATLLIVTGASRGIGRAIAVTAAQRIDNIHVCLLSRNLNDLQSTKELMKEATKNTSLVSSSSCHQIDLSDLESLSQKMEELVDDASIAKYEKAILISNAGSLGYVGPSSGLASLEELRKNIDLNITSSIWLSSWFLRLFGKPNKEFTIVNISSLCAIQPFPTMGVYCSTKASRDMFHAVMAKELDDNSNVKVFSYAPGMVETDMSISLAQSNTLDRELNHSFKTSYEQKTMVKPNETAETLLNFILSDEFERLENGSHIDYWDLINPSPSELLTEDKNLK